MTDGELAQLLADGHSSITHVSSAEREFLTRDLMLAVEQLMLERMRLRTALSGLWRSMDVVPQDTHAMNAALTRLRHLHPPKETTHAAPAQAAIASGR